jgi:hypothetical protein
LSRKSDRRASGVQIELPDAVEEIVPWPQGAPAPFGCPLDDNGTRRIVSAVGASNVPQGLKLEALRDDLRGCYSRWRSLTQLSSNTLARQRFQRFHAVAKRAECILALLDDGVIGGWVREQIAMTFPLKEGAPVRKTAEFRTDHGQPDPAPSFNGLLGGLQRLAESARYKAAYFSDFALYRLSRSPLEYFVANVLPKVFQVHFKHPMRKFSRASAGSKARGPYIRFAEAALRELGITNKGKPYAPETIAKAITDVRTGRVRRQKKKVA